MWKAVVASAAFVLLIGAGARGDLISQDQGLSIGTENVLNLMHGQQNASSSQDLIVSITQDVQGGGNVFGSASVIGINSTFGGLSAMSSMMTMGHALATSGLVSSFALHSLSDQARLYELMLSGN